MASLFDIGINGLRAQQAALNVVGQNITNASTPGYTRQRADIVTQSGNLSGLNAGAGAKLDQIVRVADFFVDQQIRTDSALKSEMESYAQFVGQLETTLFDGDFGVDTAIRDFFDAVQDSANEPSDLAVRQFVISNADALASRFQGVTDRAWLQARDVSGSLESNTNQVNELTQLIVQVNERISALQSGPASGGANALLDRREILLKDLSKLVSVSTIEQNDGQINVFVGKGQPLILGSEAAEMGVSSAGEITLRPVGSQVTQNVTASINGGEIGGILKYREEVLWPTQNELGRLAAAISRSFNDQHAAGIDLDGQFGQQFFRDVNDPALVSQRVSYLGNSGALGPTANPGRISVYIEDPFGSVASDYEVRFSETSDGAYTITRRSDGEVVQRGTPFVTPHSVEFDGLRVEFTAGDFRPGDAMLLRPYADFGSQLEVVLDDPKALALGSPVQLAEDPTNGGSGFVSVAGITDPAHPIFANDGEMVPPLLIDFLSDTQYRVLDNSDPGNPVPLQPDLGILQFVPGGQNQLLPVDPGTTVVQMSGPNVSALPAVAELVTDLDAAGNNYPGGLITISGAGDRLSNLPVNAGASAAEIAAQLNGVPGVYASAQTELTLSQLVNFDSGVPVEIAVNGISFTGFDSLADLADQMASDVSLQSAGIMAKSDGQTLTLTDTRGADLSVHFQGDPNESVLVTNSKDDTVALSGSVSGTYRSVTVGGQVTTLLDPGVTMSTQFAGLFAANPVQQRADLGFDLVLTGTVEAGDRFYADFNNGGLGDNRNGLALAGLSDRNLVGDPGRSFGGTFASVVQKVGIASNQASINRDAATALLSQSEAFRESVSGVNLDEEAANLLRYEQAYNASSQIISVARDIFNILLNAVS